MAQLILLLILAVLPATSRAYPIDGYDYTHIRRLAGTGIDSLLPGARLPLSVIAPSGHGVAELPTSDAGLAAGIRSALGETAPLYSVALLDLTDPDQPRYAVHNESMIANVGSVGKFMVLFALFEQLARLYPDDITARERVLRETMVTADDWIISDSHTVPIADPDAGRIVKRRLRIGDTGNLWEYLDWMMSASSNAAASMVSQQVLLLERFGHDYPAAPEVMRSFLDHASPAQLGEFWLPAIQRPLIETGFSLERIRQGAPFTATAQRRVAGTSSYANARDLIRLLNMIESETFVDAWSSREAKRLLYITQRRIRYASHPVLNDSAVYFKSGSFFSCQPEPGFVCRQYRGNKVNRLASIAIIESPAENPKLRYMVAVMSNVLRVNSAVAHQTLALRIHRLVEAAHREASGGTAP